MLKRTLTPFLALTMGLAAMSGCGGEDSNGDAGDPATAPAGAGSPAASTLAIANGTPTAQDFERLSTIEVPGFTRSDSRVIASAANALYTSTEKTAGGANILVTVRVAGCDPFICRTLDPKDYQSAEAQQNLKAVLSAALLESPGLVWEFGPVELAAGRSGLFTYTAGYIETASASGASRVSTNTYRAWYHDGHLHVSVEVTARGSDFPRSLAETFALMSRAEAGQAARDVFAAFLAEFAK